ncbi:GNAT family N-acetyltransferase [Flavobacterium silvaticum]|uniref:GNAT family N-acetyltransferase n=1 Tax=Flavobacterium silvaticum TaxID=1852020 RepID=A0A972FN80_9FLAO|nr:GNAT family N-acetyltransferase [Flavobacterium silvaticum]NMH28818.1 GNAT family N-acetyltransferase [Flavobacterium silvaticum]
MIFREAIAADIPQIQIVRNSVKENMLSNPALVTDADCYDFMFHRGKGWVCEADGKIVGFAIADLVDSNIWALFLDPESEGKGIGKRLHDMMLDWYFDQDKSEVWLGTAPGTRAEKFYEKMGWHRNGMHGKEVRFEMSRLEWLHLSGKNKA